MKKLTAVTNRPSGFVLPNLLRQAHSLPDDTAARSDKSPDDIQEKQRNMSQFLSRQYPSDRQWTTESIEQALQQSWTALSSIQQQIMRGEETYFEETALSGNIFRGWDAFMDARFVPNCLDAPSTGPTTGSSSIMMAGNNASRRVPADARWASSSCANAARFQSPCQLMPKTAKVPASAIITQKERAATDGATAGEKGTTALQTMPEETKSTLQRDTASATKTAGDLSSSSAAEKTRKLTATTSSTSGDNLTANKAENEQPDKTPSKTTDKQDGKTATKRKERSEQDQTSVALRRPKRKRKSS